MKIIAQFDIPYYQILNEQSQLVANLPLFAHETSSLIQLYRLMVLNRLFDAKAIALQRTGRIGTYPSMRGQEGVFVGVGHALEKNDRVIPYYRDAGILMQRGVKGSDILLYWGGDERGNCFASSYNFPYSVPVGSQSLYAVGVATALKIHEKKQAVLTVCGEGASSQGDFYEAMNVAGIWGLPVVFVVCNNQWAISVPRHQQTAAQTIAQKAIAAGFSGEQIDGNDVIAVRYRTAEALKRAREQQIPTLLEMVCYRQQDHTTADDARRYEMPGIREKEWVKEPILRLRRYLESLHVWSEKEEAQMLAIFEKEIEKMVADYEAILPQAPESIFDYLYATLPKAYQEQREHLKKWSASDA